MDPVRYRILGTTQARRPDGTPVQVGGARLRALLTVLALRAGRTVPVSLLLDEVWDGDPPADAPGALPPPPMRRARSRRWSGGCAGPSARTPSPPTRAATGSRPGPTTSTCTA